MKIELPGQPIVIKPSGEPTTTEELKKEFRAVMLGSADTIKGMAENANKGRRDLSAPKTDWRDGVNWNLAAQFILVEQNDEMLNEMRRIREALEERG